MLCPSPFRNMAATTGGVRNRGQEPVSVPYCETGAAKELNTQSGMIHDRQQNNQNPPHLKYLVPQTQPVTSHKSPVQSSCVIPVPKRRLDEAIAAAAFNTACAPVLLCQEHENILSECQGEQYNDITTMSSSCSSTNSCDLYIDVSDPSTPSPPLHPAPSSALSDVGIDDYDTTYFLFGDPVPRKRKNSGRLMYRCLWKNCGKVLSTSSAIQKHIREAHLGRHSEQEHSDGEEDFYFTEMDVNVDTLTDGLSSLTPTSPTTAVPPVFPCAGSFRVANSTEFPTVSPLSLSAPSMMCHVHTDHAYQAMSPVGVSTTKFSFSWLPPSMLIKAPPVRPPLVTTVSNLKPSSGTRKPRGEAKKCRKVYGMERRDMWCTACRWKKACQRFID
ncbi:SLC2A4 regulator [Bombina bombina]|uniref:SLC2A4 regulator n=1 Tax=Bombina bombina TaxID=8345 RepID=UPI00235AECF2|nr:SLC2A4 regulator [Bombina bombina]